MTIPADILEKAEQCHETIMRQAEGVGLTKARAVQNIARAIMEERERCAQIAETPRCNTCGKVWQPNSEDCCPWPDLETSNRNEIASAIRNEGEQKP